MSNNIKVSVRVRPLLPRELKAKKAEGEATPVSLVSMPPSDPHKVLLTNPKTQSKNNISIDNKPKSFLFDECIWSFNSKDLNYIDNHKYYEKTGPQLLSHFFEGYNVCLLAYGQTGSGKTYTMMGDKNELPGIIPLLIKDILKQMEISVNEKINCELKFLYIEIYNEQVKDLLTGDTKNGNGNGNSTHASQKCKVREHPVTGPYVENVKEYNIENYTQFLKLLAKGNSSRSTASTSMNDKSSRSHAIITLTLKQTKFEKFSGFSSDSDETNSIGDASEEMVSNIKLVDLAGSERLQKTKLYGQQERIKEGTLINKSLAVLGRCINLLSSNPSSLIPYRESILTYLLKENLGGNSKTCMIFCVSPVDYEETHQTLNYANEVKKIKTLAKANKTKLSNVPIDWQQLQLTDKTVIQSLKNEIDVLTNKLNQMQQLNEPRSHPPQSINNIIEYLDKETNKVKFENKYLKQMMNTKNNHIKELNNHIDFISNEYQLLYNDYEELKRSSLLNRKQELLKECESNKGHMDMELREFEQFLVDAVGN